MLAIVTLTALSDGCSRSGAANPAAANFATALRNKVTSDAMTVHLTKLQDIGSARPAMTPASTMS